MSLFQSIFPVGLGFFAWPAVVSSLPRCGVPAHAKLRGTIAGEGKEEQHRVLHLFSPALMSTVDEPNPSSPEMVLPGSRSLCVEAFHSIVCYSQSLLMVYIRQQQADCQKWSLPNFLSQHFGKSRYTHLLGIRTSWSSKAGHAIFHGPKRELCRSPMPSFDPIHQGVERAVVPLDPNLVHRGHQIAQHPQKPREDHGGGQEQQQDPATLLRRPERTELERVKTLFNIVFLAFPIFRRTSFVKTCILIEPLRGPFDTCMACTSIVHLWVDTVNTSQNSCM